MSMEDARERAERLLAECGDGMSPTNLDGILRHLGGKIEQAQGVTASLADRPGKFVLILRPLKRALERRRKRRRGGPK